MTDFWEELYVRSAIATTTAKETATDVAFLDEVLPKKGRILDVGCGWGRHLEGLLAIPGNERGLFGIDTSEFALTVARAKSLPVSWYDFDDPIRVERFDGFYFDAVYVMCNTLFLTKERVTFLEYIRDTLEPGGILVLHNSAPGSLGKGHDVTMKLPNGGNLTEKCITTPEQCIIQRTISDPNRPPLSGEATIWTWTTKQHKQALDFAGLTVESIHDEDGINRTFIARRA